MHTLVWKFGEDTYGAAICRSMDMNRVVRKGAFYDAVLKNILYALVFNCCGGGMAWSSGSSCVNYVCGYI
jgi:hypothetical protein